MRWKELAAQAGTSTLVGGLKALETQLNKRQFKRVIATTVAQLLELHPDFGARKARRWARRATGARPSKKIMHPSKATTAKEALGAVAATAATAGAAKIVGRLASNIGDKITDAHDRSHVGNGREDDASA